MVPQVSFGCEEWVAPSPPGFGWPVHPTGNLDTSPEGSSEASSCLLFPAFSPNCQGKGNKNARNTNTPNKPSFAPLHSIFCHSSLFCFLFYQSSQLTTFASTRIPRRLRPELARQLHSLNPPFFFESREIHTKINRHNASCCRFRRERFADWHRQPAKPAAQDCREERRCFYDYGV